MQPSGTAQHDREQRQRRAVPAQQLGTDERLRHCPLVPGHASHRATQHEGGQFVAINGQAECAHPMLVSANAQQGPAKQRAHQPGRGGVHQHEHREVDPQQHGRPLPPGHVPDQVAQAERGPGDEHAVRPAAQLRIVENKVDHLPKGQRGHEEIKTLGA